jgi:hypothetical protein
VLCSERKCNKVQRIERVAVQCMHCSFIAYHIASSWSDFVSRYFLRPDFWVLEEIGGWERVDELCKRCFATKMMRSGEGMQSLFAAK